MFGSYASKKRTTCLFERTQVISYYAYVSGLVNPHLAPFSPHKISIQIILIPIGEKVIWQPKPKLLALDASFSPLRNRAKGAY